MNTEGEIYSDCIDHSWLINPIFLLNDKKNNQVDFYVPVWREIRDILLDERANFKNKIIISVQENAKWSLYFHSHTYFHINAETKSIY